MTAFFVLPVLKNINVEPPYKLALFTIIPFLWILLLFFSRLLGRYFSWSRQFGKFLITGFLNTSIDFGILNIMSMKYGIYAGLRIIGINPLSFLAAITNSFFWNKYWTFETKNKPKLKEIGGFLLVAIIGVIINTGIVLFITAFIAPFSVFNEGRILNLAKAIATGFVLFWNFWAMKIFVFKKQIPSSELSILRNPDTIGTKDVQIPNSKS